MSGSFYDARGRAADEGSTPIWREYYEAFPLSALGSLVARRLSNDEAAPTAT